MVFLGGKHPTSTCRTSPRHRKGMHNINTVSANLTAVENVLTGPSKIVFSVWNARRCCRWKTKSRGSGKYVDVKIVKCKVSHAKEVCHLTSWLLRGNILGKSEQLKTTDGSGSGQTFKESTTWNSWEVFQSAWLAIKITKSKTVGFGAWLLIAPNGYSLLP